MKLMLFEDFINKEVSKEERKEDTSVEIEKEFDKKDLSKIKDKKNSEEVINLPNWDQY